MLAELNSPFNFSRNIIRPGRPLSHFRAFATAQWRMTAFLNVLQCKQLLGFYTIQQLMMALLLDRKKLLSLTADDIGKMLRNRTLSVVDVVKAISQRIQEDNNCGLNLAAIISVAPEEKLLELAEQLDREMADNKPRGPLHGIPVVIKDCFVTHADLGMTTSAGSNAFLQNRPMKNAPVVDKLLAGGAIVIGKSNLTELCCFKGYGLVDGFSSVGGQTKSPYVYGDPVLDEGDLSPWSPGGSSTGSAVSVSAGFAFIGIGTETDGSIVTPSSRQALYCLKPCRGLIDCSGAFRVSRTLDTPGAMARSARDVAMATTTMLDDSTRISLPGGSYESFFSDSFEGLKVGFVNPTLWRLPPDFWVPSEEAKHQHDASYHAVIQTMKTLGAQVVYPVELPEVEMLKIGSEFAQDIVPFYECATATEDFLKEYFEEDSSIRSLGDIVQYNKDHPKECLPKNAPDQACLIKAVENPPSEDKCKTAFAHMHKVAKVEGLDQAFSQHNLDVVFVPMDSSACTLSTASGKP
ncbi:hypothetical protein J7T55_003425 [Diaporthe amygdali]|uniref:uncharacterized protein n=1 Tax=Phomopsis amygdali TaxID=1214568 RepID=UPI0022FDC522|nr:uncharacterized protein J7T55_003425 [Diaporthe amygdali]KAJ0117010.1 hypothetical protein J7T55_003425 [Diaporthe amygdali]